METDQYILCKYIFVNCDSWTSFRCFDIKGTDSNVEFSYDKNNVEEAMVNFTIEAGQKFSAETPDGTYLMYDGFAYNGNMTM